MRHPDLAGEEGAPAGAYRTRQRSYLMASLPVGVNGPIQRKFVQAYS